MYSWLASRTGPGCVPGLELHPPSSEASKARLDPTDGRGMVRPPEAANPTSCTWPPTLPLLAGTGQLIMFVPPARPAPKAVGGWALSSASREWLAGQTTPHPPLACAGAP